MKILGTGLSGLVGSRIVECLSNRIEFESSEVDITNKAAITEKIIASNASTVIHLAAKTNVDGCEQDKEKGEAGDAWKINVLGTEYITDACVNAGKKLLYISTDFVFDGMKEEYKEEDVANPVNWYGYTKYMGEEVVKKRGKDFTIVRIAYPYRALLERPSLVTTLFLRLSQKQPIAAVTDHIMTPTFIDDIAKALEIIIKERASGIYHVVGSEHISPYDLVMKIARVFGFSTEMVTATTREEYFKNRAPRGFRLALKNDRIEKLGLHMSSLDEGLKEVKKLLVL